MLVSSKKLGNLLVGGVTSLLEKSCQCYDEEIPAFMLFKRRLNVPCPE